MTTNATNTPAVARHVVTRSKAVSYVYTRYYVPFVPLDQMPGYDPDALLDSLLEQFQLKNDAKLCAFLEIPPPIVSKVRHRRAGISAELLIRMHDRTGLSLDELRRRLGVVQAG